MVRSMAVFRRSGALLALLFLLLAPLAAEASEGGEGGARPAAATRAAKRARIVAAATTGTATTPTASTPRATPLTATTLTGTSTSGTGTPPPAKPPAKPATLYRIVGCRSRGGLYTGGPWRREVAIGFDDGPAALTPSFVRMLERQNAKATFFMIGEQVTGAYRETLLRELRDGDALGDHTWSHPDLALLGNPRAQLQSALAAIRGVSGYTPCVFRPPYGAYNSNTVSAARSLGMATVTWDVDPTDWALPGTGAIVSRVLAQVHPGSIILSHDGGGPRGQTLAAYPQIFSALRARGYRFVTIPELLGFRPVYRPCIKLCAGIGVPRSQVPRNALLERAP